MPEHSALGTLHNHVELLFSAGTAVGLTDRELLERFLDHGRESADAAFRTLVERHGPMVLTVCNQALKNPHAAEDAFQATFLVLVRQARSIRKRDSVQSWLFGVACRSAARIRMLEARRKCYEQRAATVKAFIHSIPAESPDPWPELHAEIANLPDKYRVPIVLCYFEGLTHEQAAARLGWPVGTVKTRLTRARDQLRWRLSGRAWNSAPLVLIKNLRHTHLTEVPRHLLDRTVQAAAGKFISSYVLAITSGVTRAMVLNDLRFAAVSLFGAAALGCCALAVARQAPQEGQNLKLPGAESIPPAASQRPGVLRLFGTTSFNPDTILKVWMPLDGRVDKVLIDLGSPIKPGDPLLEFFSTELADAKSLFETATGEWQHAKEVLANLNDPDTLPRKQIIELKNDESRSRLKMKIAREKLLVYGLTEKEIENAKNEDGVQKATMILRSRRSGVVIKRNVVRGNFYDPRAVLLEIASLDPLHIIATVDPREVGELKIGESLTVHFPFGGPIENARIEAITPEDEFGKVTVRTSIPNPDGRMKAGMFVRLGVKRPPPAPGSKPTGAPEQSRAILTMEERLTLVERKLDRLLTEKDHPPGNAEVLERLSNLERKLDRALNARSPK